MTSKAGKLAHMSFNLFHTFLHDLNGTDDPKVRIFKPIALATISQKISLLCKMVQDNRKIDPFQFLNGLNRMAAIAI